MGSERAGGHWPGQVWMTRLWRLETGGAAEQRPPRPHQAERLLGIPPALLQASVPLHVLCPLPWGGQ